MKKIGWVWWVVESWKGKKHCFGPYSSRKEALSHANWTDKVVRKSTRQRKPEGCED